VAKRVAVTVKRLSNLSQSFVNYSARAASKTSPTWPEERAGLLLSEEELAAIGENADSIRRWLGGSLSEQLAEFRTGRIRRWLLRIGAGAGQREGPAHENRSL